MYDQPRPEDCMYGGVYRVSVGKTEGNRPLGVDGRIILRWLFRK